MPLLFGVTAGLFLIWTLGLLWHLRWVRRLPSLERLNVGGQPAAAVRCSIVVAARNEEARIEQTMRGLLSQNDVEVELIVVDDRSTDRTREILRRLASTDRRLQLKCVDALPEGWLGKCHACYVGAGAATSEWILFADADCWVKSDVIIRAIRVAEREQADHVTITSGLAGGLGLKASHVMFLISFANWFSGVNRDKRKSFMGIGAFNLVRATAYRQCGGYEVLRLTVLDDMKLGLLLRRAGKRTRAFMGGDDVECHWGTSVWGMVKLMEKNYFAAVDYRFGLVIGLVLFVSALLGVLFLALICHTAIGLIAVLSPFSLVLPAAILARRLGWSWSCALFVPFVFPVFVIGMLNSAWVTLRQGGVRWRETFYPLETLRSHNVR
jgi:glycosyltransferase involved in cell wall biosynthesis